MSTASPAPAEPTPDLATSAYEDWLERNFKKLLLLVLLVILAVAAYFIVRYRTDALRMEAGAAFTSADSIEAHDAVISKFAGTPAAANSLLKKAELLWDKNQKDSSVEALRKFLAGHPKHPLLMQTKLALATRLEVMGEKDEARKLYEEITASATASEVTPLAEIRLADLLWSEGKLEEAKTLYAGLPSKYPGTNQPFFDQSQERLKWAGADLPTTEVDPPAPPPAPEGAAEAPAPKPPGTIELPPINLANPNAAGAPMSVTVSPEGGVTTAPVEIKPTVPPPAEMPAEPAPAAPQERPEAKAKAREPKPEAPAAAPSEPAKPDSPQPKTEPEAPAAPATKPE